MGVATAAILNPPPKIEEAPPPQPMMMSLSRYGEDSYLIHRNQQKLQIKF